MSRAPIFAAFFSIVLIALVLVTGASGEESTGEIPVVRFSKVDTPPVIDGRVDDRCWGSLPTYGSFTAASPHPGTPSCMSTNVSVCYDDSLIYVGFRCADPNPDEIIVRSGNRDARLQGDAVFVILDTFDDNRTGYLFQANAAGAQTDVHIEDDGRVRDDTWDATWRSGAWIAPDGWEAEFAIPIREMRFPRGEVMTWGINFGRIIAREPEYSYLAPLAIDDQWLKISRCARGIGLEGDFSPAKGQVVPTFAARLRTDHGGSEFEGHTTTGLNAKINLSSNFAVDVTTNPDFGEISADPNVVSLSRYEIRYAERRPFFVERNDAFATPLELFYSRRVGRALGDGTAVPIDAGARLTGKQGGVTVAALGVRTGAASYLDAGGFDAEEASALHGVFRASYERENEQKWGVLATSRREAGETQSVAGLDGSASLPWGWEALGQTAVSLSSAANDHGNGAFKGKLWRYRDSYNISFRYREIGRGFDANDLGYVPWIGQKRIKGYAGLTPRPDRWGVRRVAIGSSLSAYRVVGDRQWSRTIAPSVSVSLDGGHGFFIGGDRFSEYYDGQSWEGGSWSTGGYTNGNLPFWISSTIGGGDLLDYSRVELADHLWGFVAMGWKIGETASYSASAYRLWTEFADASSDYEVSTFMNQFSYFFTNDLYFHCFLQGIDYSLWDGPWEDRVDFDLNALASVREGGLTLYVGWNISGSWNYNEKARVVKVSYLSRF